MAGKSRLINPLLANRAPGSSCPRPTLSLPRTAGAAEGRLRAVPRSCSRSSSPGFPNTPNPATSLPTTSRDVAGTGANPCGLPIPTRGRELPPHRDGGDSGTPPRDEERGRRRDGICREVQAGALPHIPPLQPPPHLQPYLVQQRFVVAVPPRAGGAGPHGRGGSGVRGPGRS